jgi:outer membrane receptor protein involved in Fe transport
MKSKFHKALMLSAALVATTTSLNVSASAQAAKMLEYRMPAQPLAVALRSIASASGTNILAPGALVEGKQASALEGRYSVADAVTSVLRGSGLRLRTTDAGLIIEAGGAEDDARADPNAQGTIVVTGTRIKGAPVAAPVIRLSQREIRNSGQASLAEVARSIPQSFGGGQQPGIGFNVPGTNGVDVGGGSSINLRGLGGDATLTLVNGHRVAYNSSRQSVDVSAIPLSMVDRIEIVADGASAVYGSDAVAGVANVILLRDYEGLETRARLGASTDGGNFTQQYGALAGATWQGGGLAAAYEFNRNTAIRSGQRDYARDRSPGLDLFPALRTHSVAATAHQSLGPDLNFAVDALYNRRNELIVYPLEPGGDLTVARGEQRGFARSWAVAPAFTLSAGRTWQIELAGTAANDHTRFQNDAYDGSLLSFRSEGCYCNSGRSVELGASGSLTSLPAGEIKSAFGAGYRRNALDFVAAAGNPNNFSRAQASYFAYGELSIPIVSPAMAIEGIERLALTGAVRYENYRGVGEVATPKLGLIYAPSPGLEVKGSWGRSFRAATLRQQYQPKVVQLFQPAAVGGANFPAAATVAFVSGGNPDLSPERATSWTATLVVHPERWGAARLELGYFSTVYRGRIVTPIALRSQSLSNPLYRDYVQLTPSAAQVMALVSSAAVFINSSGLPYDPGTVVAVVDSSNVNAGRQRIHGADLLLSDRWDLGVDRSFSLSANASYLTSDQRIIATQPKTKLAGTIFNPPRLRLRASAEWQQGGLTLDATVSHTGGIDDVRSSPAVAVAGMTPIDLTARYVTRRGGAFGGLDLILSVQNVVNDKPSAIDGIFLDAPYDSTNYSPVGRYVSLSVAKRW